MALCPYKFYYQKQMIDLVEYHQDGFYQLSSDSGPDNYKDEEQYFKRRVANEV